MGPPDKSIVSYPLGSVNIDQTTRQITGHNAERQDSIIGPNSAPNFAGYFCARFSEPFLSWGTASNADGKLIKGNRKASGKQVSGYVTFDKHIKSIDVRIGVSFISEDQACSNVDDEIPDGTAIEETARKTRAQWAEKLDRIKVQGGNPDELTVLYTAIFHSLQVSLFCWEKIRPNKGKLNCCFKYPYEQSEGGRYYSGYDDSIHAGESYTGYSIWVCFGVLHHFGSLLDETP